MGNGGNMDTSSIITGIISSGAGGAILTFIVGFIKSKMTSQFYLTRTCILL